MSFGFTLGADAEYAKMSTSQSNLGTATRLCVKIRVDVALLLSVASGSFQTRNLLNLTDDSATERITMEIYDNNGPVGVRCLGTSAGAIYGQIARASLTDTHYVFYGEFAGGANEDGPVLFDTAGSIIIDGTIAGTTYTINNSGTGNGKVVLGKAATSANAAKGFIDGVAIYSDRLTGAARYSAPAAGDANLLGLWFFDEGSGTSVANAVGGGQALDSLSGTWTSGGIWDGAGGGGATGGFRRLVNGGLVNARGLVNGGLVQRSWSKLGSLWAPSNQLIKPRPVLVPVGIAL